MRVHVVGLAPDSWLFEALENSEISAVTLAPDYAGGVITEEVVTPDGQTAGLGDAVTVTDGKLVIMKDTICKAMMKVVTTC